MTAEPEGISIEASINAVRAKLDSDGMLVCNVRRLVRRRPGRRGRRRPPGAAHAPAHHDRPDDDSTPDAVR